MNPKKLILLPQSSVKVVNDNGTEEIKQARPIMMKPWGIEATLERRKTVTRRIVTPQPYQNEFESSLFSVCEISQKKCISKTVSLNYFLKYCRQGKPGDLIYIKENYVNNKLGHKDFYNYFKSWKSPLFMPRKAAQIWLLINDIRCERLQDITEEDCLKEGIINAYCKIVCPSFLHNCRCNPTCNQVGNCDKTQGLKRQFAKEWDKINANRKDKAGSVLPYAWKDNPFVFSLYYSLFFQGRGVYEKE